MNPLEWALLSDTARAILRIFHGFRSRGQQAFPKHSWLARTIGVCRLTIVRAIARLVRMGFIMYRRRSRFCEYTLLREVNATSKDTSKDTSDVTSQRPVPILASERRSSGRKNKETFREMLLRLCMED